MEVLEGVVGVFLGEAMNEEVLIVVVDFLPEGVIVVVTGVEQEVMRHTKNCSQVIPSCIGTPRGQIVKRVFSGFFRSDSFRCKGKVVYSQNVFFGWKRFQYACSQHDFLP